MKEIIEELQSKLDYELHQIGMTPHSEFNGTQREHDFGHALKAVEYQKAIDKLKQ